MTKLFWFSFAMSAVLITWLVIGLTFIGIGRMITQGRRLNLNRAFIHYWLGLAITLAFLQIWSLFAPINFWPMVIVLGSGLFGLMTSRSLGSLADHARRALRSDRRTILFIVCFTLFLANHALGPADLYDTRMYHINAVRWANTFPVVPGLANLQRNIAFNNAGHLLAAMVNVGPWTGRSQHVVAGLFLLPLGLRGIVGMSRFLGKRGTARIDDRFFALSFPAVLALALRPEIASLSSDLPAATMTFVCIGLMLRWLRRPDRATWLALLTTLCAAIACKLSTIGLVAIAFPIVALLPMFTNARRRWKAIVIASAVGLLFAVPYVTRGVIMSGYPLFPMGIGGQDVEWKYPADELVGLQAWIRAHGRGEEPDGTPPTDWLGRWTNDALTKELDRTLPAAIFTFIAIGWLIGCAGQVRRREFLAVLPALAATVVWFITSPAIRFGFAFPWAMAAAVISILWVRQAREVGVLLAILCLLCFVHTARMSKGDPLSVARKVIIFPGADHGFHPPPPATHKVFVSRHGMLMHVPVSGNFIWSAPLPSTHLPNPDLRMRTDDLKDGFVIDRR